MTQQQIYSEADMGDMSHYDPNLGIKYPKTNTQRKQTHKKKFGTTKLPPRGTGIHQMATMPNRSTAGNLRNQTTAMNKFALMKMAKPASYKKGGKVKKTGLAKVHKGEVVLTKKQASPKIMQKHPSGTRTIKPSVRKQSATIIQKNRQGDQKYRFPMPDKSHARNALARLNQAKGLSSSQKATIKSKAERILGSKDKIKRSLRKTMGYE